MKLGRKSVTVTPLAGALPAFTTSIVYANVSPGARTASLTRFEIETTGLRSCVVADALTGAVALFVSVAVFVTDDAVMPFVVLTVKVSVADAPAASVPTFQLTVPLLPTA